MKVMFETRAWGSGVPKFIPGEGDSCATVDL